MNDDCNDKIRMWLAIKGCTMYFILFILFQEERKREECSRDHEIARYQKYQIEKYFSVRAKSDNYDSC